MWEEFYPPFPKDLIEFDRMFGTEEACREYLLSQRWPDGFRCPACGHHEGWTNHRHHIECRACHHQTSLTAGTVMSGTRKPLRVWFQAMWWVCTQKTGVSAAGLRRILGLKSMQTAWTWLHKLRQAMVRVDRERLNGKVQVDDAMISPESPRRGKPLSFKSVRLMVAVEMKEDDSEFGRIRIEEFGRAGGEAEFVRANVDPEALLETDASEALAPLEREGYRRVIIREAPMDRLPGAVAVGSGMSPSGHSPNRSRDAAHRVEGALPRVQRVVALLKRWLVGTHQGRMVPKHLQSYLDEFVFRYNRRKSKHVGLIFQRMVKQSAETSAVTYRNLVSGARGGRP